jgi:hypothetical protein
MLFGGFLRHKPKAGGFCLYPSFDYITASSGRLYASRPHGILRQIIPPISMRQS